MKNMVKIFGIIVLAAVIGFGLTACEDIREGDSSTDGRLTITGLNGFGVKGWKITGADIYWDPTTDIFAFTHMNDAATNYLEGGSAINGDSFTFYVWIIPQSKGIFAAKNYTGNDKNQEVNISLSLTIGQESVWINYTVTVNFTNGKATVAFNDVFKGTWTATENRTWYDETYDRHHKIAAEYGSFKYYISDEDEEEIEAYRGVYGFGFSNQETECSISLLIREINMLDDDTEQYHWVSYDDMSDDDKAGFNQYGSGTLTNGNKFSMSGGQEVIFTKQ